MISNFHSQPGPDPSLGDSRGIYFTVRSQGSSLMVVNARIDRTNAESVLIEGGANTLLLANFTFGRWDDRHGGQVSAINAGVQNYVKISNPTFESQNARYYGGDATYIGVAYHGSFAVGLMPRGR